MDDSLTFGAWLRRQRRDRDLSQQELADRVGCAVVTIRKLEKDRQRPSRSLAQRIVRILGIDPHDQDDLVRLARTTFTAPVPGAGRLDDPRPAPLPTQATKLIGRTRDLATIASILSAGARLLTVTGPPGVGKTRLSLAFAHTVGPSYPGGIFFVDLTTTQAPEQIAPALGAALGLTALTGPGQVQSVAHALRDRRALLILDNLEHLLSGVAVITDILAAAPDVTVLATSQSRLALAGEHEYALAPLETPPAPHPWEHAENVVDGLLTNESVQLFVQAARAQDARFQVDRQNAAAIAALCRALDGLPLAIELAAARLSLFAPSTLLDHLRRSGLFDLLTHSRRDAPPRHQTLRSAIAWSYDLLGPMEQAVLRALTLLETGVDIEIVLAAAQDLIDRRGSPERAQDVVQSLVEKSLVRRSIGDGGQPRLGMLESIRAYGREQLTAHGEDGEARQAMARAVEAYVRTAMHHVVSGNVAWLERLEAEVGAVLTVLAWAAESLVDSEVGLAIVGLLQDVLPARLITRQGGAALHILPRVVQGAPAGTDEGLRMQAQLVLLGVLVQSSREVPEMLLEEIVSYWAAAGDHQRLAYAQMYRAAVIGRSQGADHRGRALALLAESERVFSAAGNSIGRMLVRHLLARVLRAGQQYTRAAAVAAEHLRIAEGFGDAYGIAWGQYLVGLSAVDLADIDRAGTALQGALAHFRHIGQEIGEIQCLWVGVRVALARGKPQAAYDPLVRSIHIASTRQDAGLLERTAGYAAAALLDEGRLEAAAEVLCAVRGRSGLRHTIEQHEHARLLDGVEAALRARLAPEAIEAVQHHTSAHDLPRVLGRLFSVRAPGGIGPVGGGGVRAARPDGRRSP